MKTATDNIKFPGTAKFFTIVFLISGITFLTSMVTNAQLNNEVTPIYFVDKQYKDYTTILKSGIELGGINMDQLWAVRLETALVTEHEAELEVESWMLNAEFTAEVYEEALEVESWMLDAGYLIMDKVNEEPFELEDWMLN